MSRTAPGWVGPAVRVVASVGALAVVAALVGGEPLRAGAAVLSPVPVTVAVLLGLLWRALTASRWLLLARALGAPLRWGEAYAEYLRSELLNQVVPGGVVGDVDRARRHAHDVGWLPAARAVALERAVGQVVLVVAVLVTLLARPELRQVADGADRRTAVVLVTVLLLVTLLAVLLARPWRRGSARVGPGTGQDPARDALQDPAHGSRPPRVETARLLPALAASAVLSVGVLACFVALFVLAARTTGPATPLVDLVPAVLVVLLVSGIPLTVAGWGAREAGAALCFAAVGLVAADGVAAAVGYGLLALVSALPGLVPLLLPRRHRRPRPPVGRAGAHTAEVEVEARVLTERDAP